MGVGAGALWRQGYNHLPKVTIFYCSLTNGDAETVFFPCGAKSFKIMGVMTYYAGSPLAS